MASPSAVLSEDFQFLDLETLGSVPAGSSLRSDSLKLQIMRDLQAKNHAGAIAGLQKALAVSKKNLSILRWLVIVANHAGDLILARKYARKLAEADPNDANNHMFHGAILDRLGKFEEAIKAYFKADRLRPGNPKTLNAIGRAYAAKGDHAQALASFEKTLELDPMNDYALHHAAQSSKYDEVRALELVARVDRALNQTDDMSAKSRLHFAAGKLLDDAKRYDEAFPRFKAANDLVKPEKPRDTRLLFANSLAAFPDRAFFEARRDFGLPTDRPILILGMPRSGTTLTESLCAAHPEVTAGDEQTALVSLAVELGRDRAGDDYANMVGLMTAEHITAFATAYLSHCEQTVGRSTPRFTDKMPHNFLNIGLAALLFPNIRIIHCRRNPLDSCLSLYSNNMADGFHQQYKTDLSRLGEHQRAYLDLMQHWHSVLPGHIHEVFYEDLVVNTEWNARAIIDFLGLEWDEQVLDRTGSQRRVATASQWQVRQPVYQTSKDRWRRYEKHLGPLIDAIGQDRIEAYAQDLAALDRR